MFLDVHKALLGALQNNFYGSEDQLRQFNVLLVFRYNLCFMDKYSTL